MTAALTAGQIDAIANDTAYNLAYAKKSDGALVVIGQVQDRRDIWRGLPKGIAQRSGVRQGHSSDEG